MDMLEAQNRFELADELFRTGKYEDACRQLEELECHFPNNHRILNAKARTLAEMGTMQPALAICDRLLNDMHYEKIREFRDHVAAALSLAPAEDTLASETPPPEFPVEDTLASETTPPESPVEDTLASEPPPPESPAPPALALQEPPPLPPADNPDVTGMDVSEAEESLRLAALRIGEKSDAYSNSVPPGAVVSQNPAASTPLSPGTPVDLVISKGPQTVPVPDMAGMREAQAEESILAAGLCLGNKSQAHSDEVSAGDIVLQSPIAGSLVLPGTGVDLVISRGPHPVSAPDVVGRVDALAERFILRAGLRIGEKSETFSDKVPAGKVVSQNPAAAEKTAPGTPMDLVFSKGPQPVSVPGVTGSDDVSAAETLLHAGLRVGKKTKAHSDTNPVGNVVQQNPVAGTLVSPGTAVDLVISSGPQPVAVPRTAALDESSATKAILNAGLRLGDRTESYSDKVPAGIVLRQKPVEGVPVAPASTVDLVISLGPEPVSVPGVTGMNMAKTEKLIRRARLRLGEKAEAHSDTVSAEHIISQDPTANTLVAPGSPVDIVISLGPLPDSAPLPDAAVDPSPSVAAEDPADGTGSDMDRKRESLVARWHREAEEGDVRAQFRLAVRYACGLGVRQDDAIAVSWFLKAAEKEHAEAQFNLGLMHASGRGVPKDDGAALNWLLKAARQGEPAAQLQLGIMYAEGRGVTQDCESAATWYREAAGHNDPEAQYRLGLMYAEGRGVTQDSEAAATWYHKAAGSGHADAQFHLGLLCARGEGLPKDEESAVRWFRSASEQGHVEAQHNLATHYRNGQGVVQNYVLAHAWYSVAGVRLDQARTDRDELAELMTPEQLVEAQRIAAGLLSNANTTPSTQK